LSPNSLIKSKKHGGTQHRLCFGIDFTLLEYIYSYGQQAAA